MSDRRVVEIDGELYEFDADSEPDTSALTQRLAALDREQLETEYINKALERLQQQTGQELTPEECQALGEMAEQVRDAEGLPDVSVMSQALTIREEFDRLDVPEEDREEFVGVVLERPPAPDGSLDIEGAFDEVYEYEDDNAPDPNAPELHDDDPEVRRQARRDLMVARAEEHHSEARADREQRIAEREETMLNDDDPGRADGDMHPWEAEGRHPDMSNAEERRAFMGERMRELREDSENEAA